MKLFKKYFYLFSKAGEKNLRALQTKKNRTQMEVKINLTKTGLKEEGIILGNKLRSYGS